MRGTVLYSINVFLKFFIEQEYRHDVHYAWCSDVFDSRKAPAYSRSAQVPPTSNPVDIYRDLQDAVRKTDQHNAKITAQKTSLKALAIRWEGAGEISTSEKDEIIVMVDTASFDLWRPLLYVIPYEPVKLRVSLVPVAERAGFGNEYIIADLQRTDFDMIEW